MMFSLSTDGKFGILDPEEIVLASGSTLEIFITSAYNSTEDFIIKGTVKVAPRFILESIDIGNGWYESEWLGLYLPKNENWLYHHPTGWLYHHSVYPYGIWVLGYFGK